MPSSEIFTIDSVYPVFMESRILLFSISAILTGFSPFPFPIDDKSVKHIKIHSNRMKTGPCRKSNTLISMETKSRPADNRKSDNNRFF